MEKPQPKQAVSFKYEGDIRRLFVYCSSDQVAQSTRHECTDFGEVFLEGKTVILYISPLYDHQEITSYIENYWTAGDLWQNAIVVDDNEHSR